MLELYFEKGSDRNGWNFAFIRVPSIRPNLADVSYHSWNQSSRGKSTNISWKLPSGQPFAGGKNYYKPELCLVLWTMLSRSCWEKLYFYHWLWFMAHYAEISAKTKSTKIGETGVKFVWRIMKWANFVKQSTTNPNHKV